MKNKKLTMKINNQNYLFNILNKNPKISSGRKNYHNQYERVLKNVLLSKSFHKLKINNFFDYKFQFFLKKK